MDQSNTLFSDLTNEQIDELKALETSFNKAPTKTQETILIAYDNPKRQS